jgi:hypothetical protein
MQKEGWPREQEIYAHSERLHVALWLRLVDLLFRHEEVENAVELLGVGQARRAVPHRRVHVELYVYHLAEDQVFNNLLVVD